MRQSNKDINGDVAFNDKENISTMGVIKQYPHYLWHNGFLLFRVLILSIFLLSFKFNFDILIFFEYMGSILCSRLN